RGIEDAAEFVNRQLRADATEIVPLQNGFPGRVEGAAPFHHGWRQVLIRYLNLAPLRHHPSSNPLSSRRRYRARLSAALAARHSSNSGVCMRRTSRLTPTNLAAALNENFRARHSSSARATLASSTGLRGRPWGFMRRCLGCADLLNHSPRGL